MTGTHKITEERQRQVYPDCCFKTMSGVEKCWVRVGLVCYCFDVLGKEVGWVRVGLVCYCFEVLGKR